MAKKQRIILENDTEPGDMYGMGDEMATFYMRIDPELKDKANIIFFKENGWPIEMINNYITTGWPNNLVICLNKLGWGDQLHRLFSKVGWPNGANKKK